MTEPRHTTPQLHQDAPCHAGGSQADASSVLSTQSSALSRHTTPRGTPCARSWSPDWIAHVEAIEDKLDRRICGAKTPTGEPCRMCAAQSSASDCSSLSVLSPQSSALHRPSGRCNFHGGADLAGGQFGNQNAASHGLYARGLRPCSQSCPLWDKCPLACKAVAELDAPQRPTCPYELHDYQTAVKAFTDMVAPPPQADPDTLYPLEADILTRIVEIFAGPAPSAENDEPSNHVDELDPNEPSIDHDDNTDSHYDNRTLPPHLRDLVHRTATLSVMVNRAAAAMREADVIDQTNIRSNNYNATYARPHAYVQAYLRLSSEFRRYHAMLKEYAPKPTPPQQRKPLSLSDIITSINDRARQREQHNAANEDQPQSENPSTATEPPAQSDATDPSDQPEQPQEHHASPNDDTPLSPASSHSPDLDDYTSNAERFQEAARRAGAMLGGNEPSESAPRNPTHPSAPQSPTLPQKEPNPRGQP